MSRDLKFFICGAVIAFVAGSLGCCLGYYLGYISKDTATYDTVIQQPITYQQPDSIRSEPQFVFVEYGGVYVTDKGSKYHKHNQCYTIKHSNTKQVTEESALNKGYSKCNRCWR